MSSSSSSSTSSLARKIAAMPKKLVAKPEKFSKEKTKPEKFGKYGGGVYVKPDKGSYAATGVSTAAASNIYQQHHGHGIAHHGHGVAVGTTQQLNAHHSTTAMQVDLPPQGACGRIGEEFYQQVGSSLPTPSTTEPLILGDRFLVLQAPAHQQMQNKLMRTGSEDLSTCVPDSRRVSTRTDLTDLDMSELVMNNTRPHQAPQETVLHLQQQPHQDLPAPSAPSSAPPVVVEQRARKPFSYMRAVANAGHSRQPSPANSGGSLSVSTTGTGPSAGSSASSSSCQVGGSSSSSSSSSSGHLVAKPRSSSKKSNSSKAVTTASSGKSAASSKSASSSGAGGTSTTKKTTKKQAASTSAKTSSSRASSNSAGTAVSSRTRAGSTQGQALGQAQAGGGGHLGGALLQPLLPGGPLGGPGGPSGGGPGGAATWFRTFSPSTVATLPKDAMLREMVGQGLVLPTEAPFLSSHWSKNPQRVDPAALEKALVEEWELDNFSSEKAKDPMKRSAVLNRYKWEKAQATVDIAYERKKENIPKGTRNLNPEFFEIMVVSYIQIDEETRGFGLARHILTRALEAAARDSDQVISGIRFRIRPSASGVEGGVAAEHARLAYLYCRASMDLEFIWRKTVFSRTGGRAVEILLTKDRDIMEKIS